MRITNNMLVNNMMNNLTNNLTRMQKYQNQLSTGKKITVPSDDPVVAARALKLRTDVAEIEQYRRNIDDAKSWMEVTDSSLSDLQDVLQRARELAVQGSNSTNTAEDTQKIAEEIKQLKGQTIHLSNATFAGRYIFSGYKTDLKLMDENGTFAFDVKNTEDIKYEIGIGDDININVPGGELFNQGAEAVSGTKGKLIQNFEKYEEALKSGDTSAISDIIGEIDQDIENLLRVRADVGARVNRLDLTNNRLENDSLNFTKLMSQNEDVDMAETIMNLQNEENVYRASLSGGAKVIQPTLIDFLR